MNKGFLRYLRHTTTRPSPWPRKGEEYLHDFGTGQQELVFDDHAAARRFAEREGIECTGPQQRKQRRA